MSVVTPIITWISSVLGGSTGVNQSSSLTVTVSITQGWEIQVPFKVTMSNVSADPVINAYPSNDGGTNYDSNPSFSISVARISGGGTRQTSMRLPVGQYAIQFVSSGPQSQSLQVLTAMVVTAILNQ